MKRSDGYYVKNINPYQKFAAHVMPYRHDSMNMSTIEIRYKFIDEFIAAQRKLGKHYTYMDIVTCALVRLYAQRPSLNRFVIRSRIYQHNDITVSFVVKKKLVDNSEDTTVKMHFTGEESLDEVKAAIDKVVAANTGDNVFNRVDKTASLFSSMPCWLMRFMLSVLRWLDNRDILSKSFIETSPFHNSMFLTFLKSINGDAIYHHCYDFGTTGVFLAFGKEKEKPISLHGEIVSEKIMEVGCVVDERFCDGLYFVNSMRLWKLILKDPTVLLERYKIEKVGPENGVYDKETKAKYKRLEKENKKKLKEEIHGK